MRVAEDKLIQTAAKAALNASPEDDLLQITAETVASVRWTKVFAVRTALAEGRYSVSVQMLAESLQRHAGRTGTLRDRMYSSRRHVR